MFDRHPVLSWTAGVPPEQRRPLPEAKIIHRLKWPRGSPRMAVVILSHNLGAYLGDAIESVLAQEYRPWEILVVDDASEDDTPAVAELYADRGVRYLRVEHRHPFLAKRAGFQATKGEALVWLDGDDRLPPDYLLQALPVLAADRRVGLVYTDMQEFGETANRWEFPDFDRGLLEAKNYIHAGAVVLRMALEISQALDGAPGEAIHHDWRVWRRVVDAGFRAAKMPAVYQYRRRPGQLSRQIAERSYYEVAALADETVTVFLPLSGRDGPWETHLRPWLDSQTWPRDQVRLVLADTSQRDDFHARIRAWALSSDYPDVRLYRQTVGEKGLNGKPRPNDGGVEVNMAMRRIYARMARELTTAYVLVVEDDHKPPPDTIERLLRGMDPETAAVSGLYRGREPAGHYVCWSYERQQDIHPAAGPAIPVSGSGFGTLLLRRSWLDGETFLAKSREQYPYDIGYAQRVARRGGIWKLARDVLSEHAGAPSIYEPAPSPSPFPPTVAEQAALAIVGQCAHARLCSCRDRGKVECGPGGHRPGEHLRPDECRACPALQRGNGQ